MKKFLKNILLKKPFKKKRTDLSIELKRYNDRAENSLNNLNNIEDINKKAKFQSLISDPYIEIYFKLIKEISNKEKKILEICCGEGQCSKPLIENYKNIVFSDLSEKSLDVIKLRFKNYLSKSVVFKVCNMESLQFKNEEFDLVVCSGGLSYGNNNKVLNEIYRVLKKNGFFICIDSLNENPIYKLNRFIHFLKGHRTLNTLKRMPNLKLIRKYEKKFGLIDIKYSGSLLWILDPLTKFISYEKAKLLSNFFDDTLPHWMAFKFILKAKKIK